MSPSSSARNVFLASSSSGSSISTGMLATTGNHSAFLSAVRLGKKVAALQWILGIQFVGLEIIRSCRACYRMDGVEGRVR